MLFFTTPGSTERSPYTGQNIDNKSGWSYARNDMVDCKRLCALSITKCTTYDDHRSRSRQVMDSCRDRLDASRPPKDPTNRQYQDILLQVSLPKPESMRRGHIEKRNFDLSSIRHMAVAIDTDNLSCQSISSTGILGPDAAMQKTDRDVSNVRCPNCRMSGQLPSLPQTTPGRTALARI